MNWVLEGDRVRIRDSWEGGHVENTETIDVPYQGTQAQLVMVRMDENNLFKTFWNHELEVIR